MSLQELMNASYGNHPAFPKPEIENLELNVELVNQFNDEYGNPKIYINTKLLEQKRSNLLNLNSEIFTKIDNLIQRIE